MICLLIIPYLKFDLLWYSGWLSAYLIFGLLAPLVMEIIIRRRPLSVIGFRMPTNRRVLAIVAGILVLYLISRLIEPLIQGEAFDFNLRGFFSNCLLFPFLEEALFRGLIQTRLESALGTVRSWVLSGLIFGFYHFYAHFLVPGITPTISDALGLIYLSVFGMLLGVIFGKTRSLLPPFLIHAVNNLAL